MAAWPLHPNASQLNWKCGSMQTVSNTAAQELRDCQSHVWQTLQRRLSGPVVTPQPRAWPNQLTNDLCSFWPRRINWTTEPGSSTILFMEQSREEKRAYWNNERAHTTSDTDSALKRTKKHIGETLSIPFSSLPQICCEQKTNIVADSKAPLVSSVQN